MKSGSPVSLTDKGQVASRVAADLEKDRSGSPEAVIPLIVPIRFDAENGNAEDLIPIEQR